MSPDRSALYCPNTHNVSLSYNMFKPDLTLSQPGPELTDILQPSGSVSHSDCSPLYCIPARHLTTNTQLSRHTVLYSTGNLSLYKQSCLSLLKWFLLLTPPWTGDHIPRPIVTLTHSTSSPTFTSCPSLQLLSSEGWRKIAQ